MTDSRARTADWMTDFADDFSLSDASSLDGSLLARISTEMVGAMKRLYGKGPVSAKSYLVDDLLFVVMRDGLTQAERTMLEAGRADSVRQFRQALETETTEAFVSIIERLTGRRVINHRGQVMFDPDVAVAIFVFDGPEDPDTGRAPRADRV
jgi:uncharacterized protein YbcI